MAKIYSLSLSYGNSFERSLVGSVVLFRCRLVVCLCFVFLNLNNSMFDNTIFKLIQSDILIQIIRNFNCYVNDIVNYTFLFWLTPLTHDTFIIVGS